MNAANHYTEHQEELEILVQSLEDEGHEIILFNDDVNTFDHVIDCLMRICQHEPEQAEQCAWIVHLKGKCSVKKGKLTELTPRCSALLEEGLSATVN